MEAVGQGQQFAKGCEACGHDRGHRAHFADQRTERVYLCWVQDDPPWHAPRDVIEALGQGQQVAQRYESCDHDGGQRALHADQQVKIEFQCWVDKDPPLHAA